MTENHDYNTPEKGTQDWHTPLNANFTQLDEDVEIRDKASNLAGYKPKSGAKFFSLNTGKIYVGDGSNWTRLQSTGHDPKVNSLTTTDIKNAQNGGTLHASWDGLIVPQAAGLGVSDAIDPDATASPVQEAIDAVAAAGGGTVLLPPGVVEEPGPISMRSDISILGHGMETSTIRITQPGVPGIEFNSSKNGGDGVVHAALDGFKLQGPGMRTDTGPAIVHNGGNTRSLRVGRLLIMEWQNAVYKVESGNLPYQCSHEHLEVYNVDVGNSSADVQSDFEGGALFQWECWNPSPANHFTNIAVYPSASSSGSPSRILFMRGGQLSIETLNIGGVPGQIAGLCRNASVNIGYVNYEPDEAHQVDSLFSLKGWWGAKRINQVKLTRDTVDTNYVYDISSDANQAQNPGDIYLGFIRNRLGTIRTARVRVADQLAGPVLYEGESTHVRNESETTLSPGVACLGDLTLVTD